jgi:hypothetical protein
VHLLAKDYSIYSQELLVSLQENGSLERPLVALRTQLLRAEPNVSECNGYHDWCCAMEHRSSAVWDFVDDDFGDPIK